MAASLELATLQGNVAFRMLSFVFIFTYSCTCNLKKINFLKEGASEINMTKNANGNSSKGKSRGKREEVGVESENERLSTKR